MRLLGIDLGQRRVGLAISDPLGVFATALESVDGRDRDALWGILRRVVLEHEITEIVVGMPYRTDGKDYPGLADHKQEHCPASKVAEFTAFARTLEKKLSLPVHLQDERFSTVEAHRSMSLAGANSRKRRESVDRVAAVLILQTFMDKRKAEARRLAQNDPW